MNSYALKITEYQKDIWYLNFKFIYLFCKYFAGTQGTETCQNFQLSALHITMICLQLVDCALLVFTNLTSPLTKPCAILLLRRNFTVHNLLPMFC